MDATTIKKCMAAGTRVVVCEAYVMGVTNRLVAATKDPERAFRGVVVQQARPSTEWMVRLDSNGHGVSMPSFEKRVESRFIAATEADFDAVFAIEKKAADKRRADAKQHVTDMRRRERQWELIDAALQAKGIRRHYDNYSDKLSLSLAEVASLLGMEVGHE